MVLVINVLDSFSPAVWLVPIARSPEWKRNKNPDKYVVSRTPYASRKGIHNHPHERKREERDAKENKSAIKTSREMRK